MTRMMKLLGAKTLKELAEHVGSPYGCVRAWNYQGRVPSCLTQHEALAVATAARMARDAYRRAQKKGGAR